MALPPLELPPIEERVALLPGGPFALWKRRDEIGWAEMESARVPRWANALTQSSRSWREVSRSESWGGCGILRIGEMPLRWFRSRPT